ncbi:MAG: UvrABC system protein B [Candidatus Falkowbacteria bacterium GW2011_GWC2_38_22]|uniref:UvrABC system protein B n=1 Tax=Candidatus Falkowbacteria bacterium GW2011_GWE1_38_31 TaxID=1618638 RepID=A0A0G0MYN1_9BACT|nr:MAG: UvrABC system protein B [Candidatus Falkowbacteria bacterium GW2011_GWF2_38_1205]KKQ61205.1 MAG: UvrABC system protein B [Candidatus Falkowbacteria bacterium GW2011_GWC2_38_22]KKQ63289.1 MAG: UvrABC system protein B [Candidatus Falkowbacteria bacterium GW2011_GWF1_38_22]KKQ65593.1 MAG: UvrABC system protein B [Candidatus Falkowbacteria bacterium GW2011_GWE2_38_254]KKQ70021.1 MAG: UvrABC system protein B [Candidatus Falkowbacteria bacterium GW2011_GWE1_38_31]KKQ72738.1 MAG: UvrABC syste
MNLFKLHSKFKPTGDQPDAINKLLTGLELGHKEQTLLGVTGSGKTFTMANIIASVKKPTLIISHNKTLAAQLYGEFRNFFPESAVHYFVSYYDYYQPEAYIPHTDTYIEKEATINEEIDRLRHASTQSLINRKDVIIIASVSCIYGLGEKTDYEGMGRIFRVGQNVKRNDLLRQLVAIQYERNDTAFYRGQFRVKGDLIDIHLATGEAVARIQLYNDEIENIIIFTVVPNGKVPVWASDLKNKNGLALPEINILPAKHFMTPDERLHKAIAEIKLELKNRVDELIKDNKQMEAYRLESKTNYDLEMMEEVGYCNGIENYSRHLTGRNAGEAPSTLMDFFPKDFLLFIDESHATLPQIRGMHAGDQSRKQTLIDFGFRLPSARDNRPLNFKEFNKKFKQVIYVSATPSEYETKRSKQIAEQIIRPTGLLDPEVSVRPSTGQIPDLIIEIEKTVAKKQRVLVTTLTKRMAEELSEYLKEQKIKVEYLHSDIKTLERVDILQSLRQGKCDVLVGINLLREGLDLPEVSLVAILDADMSGFLRNETSLIQTMGRAARHSEGRVILYGDRMTPAMRFAVSETKRRRKIQIAYNKKHGITPRTITLGFHDAII